MFEIVVAVDVMNGIGVGNRLPWQAPSDLKKFKQLTTAAPSGLANAVIMGRNTWNSLPNKFKPLPLRQNIVITSTPLMQDSVQTYKTFQGALDACATNTEIHKVFVIGGAKLYAEALFHKDCQIVHKSMIDSSVPCDTFFPQLDMRVWKWINGDMFMRYAK